MLILEQNLAQSSNDEAEKEISDEELYRINSALMNF